MFVTRKIILSQKGFDSGSGGKANLLYNGHHVSLPIPAPGSKQVYSSMNTPDGFSYSEILSDIGVGTHQEGHLDPDICVSTIKERNPSWRGLFGQAGNSEALLQNLGVGEGDLFLFFGWYREAERRNGRFRYKWRARNVHSIYGYLEVGAIYDIARGCEVPDWARYHPHAARPEAFSKTRNRIYEATNVFSRDSSKRGWGVFRQHPSLVLTSENAATRSVWELPACFEGEGAKFNASVEMDVLENGNIRTQVKGRGNQELYVSSNPKVVEWAESLVREMESH